MSFDGEQAGGGAFDTTQGRRDGLSDGGGHRAGLVFEDVALPEGAEVESATLALPMTVIKTELFDDPNGIP